MIEDGYNVGLEVTSKQLAKVSLHHWACWDLRDNQLLQVDHQAVRVFGARAGDCGLHERLIEFLILAIHHVHIHLLRDQDGQWMIAVYAWLEGQTVRHADQFKVKNAGQDLPRDCK
jgi:hypothetical protein